MKSGTKVTISLLFLIFSLSSSLFAGNWEGLVTVPAIALPAVAVEASVAYSYTSADTGIQQEVDSDTAIRTYKDFTWLASPGGTIEEGQGADTAMISFAGVSSGVNDKTVSCQVTCEITYNGNVVETSTETFHAHLTVFGGVEIKASNGTSEPDPCIVQGGSTDYYAKVTPADLSGFGTFAWTVDGAQPDTCINPKTGFFARFHCQRDSSRQRCSERRIHSCRTTSLGFCSRLVRSTRVAA